MKTKTSIAALIAILCLLQVANGQKLKDKIEKSVVTIRTTFSKIPVERLKALDQIAYMMTKNLDGKNTSEVVLVDKNNLDISQLAMVWLQTGLIYYGYEDLFEIHSAGLSPENKTIYGLQELNTYGFNVKDLSKNDQVSYRIKYGTGSWTIRPKAVDQLKNNPNKTLKIFLEPDSSDNPTKNKIALLYSDTSNIAKEMLYMATRLDNLLSKDQ